MLRRRFVPLGLLTFALFATLAGTASAQDQANGSIAGVVKDESGAVLPGVTVEAASPALIQGTVTAVTDGQGLYKIVDLRTGVYTVTFSLTGFSTFKRGGVELTAGFTADVNAEMKVGTLSEAITVTTASPVVDVQNVLQKTALSGEVRNELPLPSNSGAYVVLIPGATQTGAANQDVGGTKSEGTQAFNIHGSNGNDYQQLRDGQFYGTMLAAGNYMSAVNTSAVQEVNVLTGGGITAESESGGAQVNIISRDGGNITSGTFLANFGSHSLQGNNITPALVARNATAPSTIRQLYEIAGGVGGPLVKSTLWYFVDGRRWVVSNTYPGQYYNQTQGTMFYTPDLGRPAYDLGDWNSGTGRLTWQPDAKDRFTAMYALEHNCDCFLNISSGTRAPEALTNALYWNPNWRSQFSWKRTQTGKLLFDVGLTIVRGQQHGDVFPEGVQNAQYTDISILDSSKNFRYNSPGQGLATQQAWGSYTFGQINEHVNASYVTGSNSFKTGFQFRYAPRDQFYFNPNNFSYTFNGKTPTTITYFGGPLPTSIRQETWGGFAQDQWTHKRLTLDAGLRLDALNSWTPAQHFPGGPYGIGIAGGGVLAGGDFPEVKDQVNWKDISPRLGGAIDLFGTGKTAVKASIARYVTFTSNASIVSNLNPLTAMVTSATRTWNDTTPCAGGVSGDYVPQPCEIGPLSNTAFGQLAPNTNYANDVTHGWGVRPYSWQGSVSIQQELRPGVALNVGYFRTWYGNFNVTDNLAVTPADYTTFSVTAPTDSRLPNSGQIITGLADVNPTKFGLVNNLVEQASKYGTQTDVYQGIDVTIQARLGKGRLIQGGLSTGQEVTDRCFVVDSPQELYQCHVAPPWSYGTQLKFSAIYPLPYAFQAAVVYQNLPPIPTTAGAVYTNAQVTQSLNRNLGACGAKPTCTSTVTVPLIAPSSYFTEPRDNQVDLRLSRTFRMAGMTMEPQFDLFNLLNGNSVLTMNQTYGTAGAGGTAWQNVTSLLGPRLIKFGVLVKF